LKDSSSSGSVPSSTSTPTSTTPSAGGGSTSTTGAPVSVAAFPFELPDKPRAQDSQALSVNTTNGAVKYDVVYSIVTVTGGKPVDSQNTAYAFANCSACTTYAVSFQLVLVVGTSKLIAPINFAGALNGNCPACVTTAIADQIVVTLKSAPSDVLVARLNDELRQLDVIKQLAANGGSPDQVAAQVIEVQHEIETELNNSGLLAKPLGDQSTSTSTNTTTAPSSTGTSTSPGGSGTTTSTTDTSTTTTDTGTTETSTTDTSTSTSTTPTSSTETTTTPSDSGTSTTASP
jgi:putative peptide zinc metalloprotease protein